MSKNHIIVFNDYQIRRTLNQGEWWFVIVDVVAVLTDSTQPNGYLKDMRRRDPELNKGWGQIATPLLMDQSVCCRVIRDRQAKFILTKDQYDYRLILMMNRMRRI